MSHSNHTYLPTPHLQLPSQRNRHRSCRPSPVASNPSRHAGARPHAPTPPKQRLHCELVARRSQCFLRLAPCEPWGRAGAHRGDAMASCYAPQLRPRAARVQRPAGVPGQARRRRPGLALDRQRREARGVPATAAAEGETGFWAGVGFGGGREARGGAKGELAEEPPASEFGGAVRVPQRHSVEAETGVS